MTKTTSVEYTASDGSLTDTATLTVTVTGANDGLTANDDAGSTAENTPLTVADGATGTTSGTTPGPGGGAQRVNADLLLNDVDIDGDDLTITEVDGDTSSVGKATSGSDGGSFTIRANGSWEFNPGTDFDDLKAGVTRTTSVEYTASDGSLTDTATLTVTVTGANDGLTANDDAGTTTENTDLTVADGATGTTSGTTPGPGSGAETTNADLLLNDLDIDGDDLTITQVNGDTANIATTTDGSNGGSFTIHANGSWSFNPGTDFDDLAPDTARITSVVYTASDGSATDTATLTVTVTPDPDLPAPTITPESRTRFYDRINIGASEISDTSVGFTLMLPEPRRVDDIFATMPAFNPVRLSAPLANLEVTDNTAQYDISDLFWHTNSGTTLTFAASLTNGDLLPYFVTFDSETGIFLFDADAAAESEATHLQIRVVAVDPDGNQASGVFRVNFTNADDSNDAAREQPDPDGSPESDTDTRQDAMLIKLADSTGEVSDQANTDTDFDRESLKEQVLRAGESGYQQGKLKLSMLLETLFKGFPGG